MNRPAARRKAALGATLLWCLGLHVQPLVHNIDHRPDHSHGPGGQPQGLAHAHPEAHSHSTLPAEPPWNPGPASGLPRLQDFAPPEPTSEGARIPAPASDDSSPLEHGTDPKHGRTSILHFTSAVLENQPVALPVPGPSVFDAVAAAPRVPPLRALRLLPSRGPPSQHP